MHASNSPRAISPAIRGVASAERRHARCARRSSAIATVSRPSSGTSQSKSTPNPASACPCVVLSMAEEDGQVRPPLQAPKPRRLVMNRMAGDDCQASMLMRPAFSRPPRCRRPSTAPGSSREQSMPVRDGGQRPGRARSGRQRREPSRVARLPHGVPEPNVTTTALGPKQRHEAALLVHDRDDRLAREQVRVHLRRRV